MALDDRPIGDPPPDIPDKFEEPKSQDALKDFDDEGDWDDDEEDDEDE